MTIKSLMPVQVRSIHSKHRSERWILMEQDEKFVGMVSEFTLQPTFKKLPPVKF